MDIKESIKFLEKNIINAKNGLPEDIFLFASRITPMVNVDLLIKDEKGRTLLSWRDDKNFLGGWHIPGGIVRFKETLGERIQKVAEIEIGAKIEFNPVPIAINQIILKQDTRGHAISFLYKCFLPENYKIDNKNMRETEAGYLKWHDSCPNNLIKVHNMYRKFI